MPFKFTVGGVFEEEFGKLLGGVEVFGTLFALEAAGGTTSTRLLRSLVE